MRRGLGLLVAALTTVAPACSSDGRTMRPPSPDQTATILTEPTTTAPAVSEVPLEGLVLTTPWPDGDVIPDMFTCRGEDVSPAIGWAAVPEGTVEVAITMTDPDAGNFVHWVVAGLDPAVGQVAQNGVPEDAVQSRNDFGTPGYRGPCPPDSTHTYLVTLYALDAASGVTDGSDPRAAISLLEQHALESVVAAGFFPQGP
jgi:Raf kinase inhibitor-like YbhB/YbcL family protein